MQEKQIKSMYLIDVFHNLRMYIKTITALPRRPALNVLLADIVVVNAEIVSGAAPEPDSLA